MSEAWKDAAREATREPPKGAKERVWRRMKEARQPRRLGRWVWAWPPAVAAAGLALFIASQAGLETKVIRTDGGVISLMKARASFDPQRRELTLTDGRLEASVWSDGLTILARGHTVKVEAAVVVVRVAADTVEVTPVRGWISFDGKRVRSPAHRGPAAAVETLEPPDAALRRARRLVELATESTEWAEAARALGEAAATGTLGAEAALLEKGELELRRLKSPAAALQTFNAARSRYPDGSLAQERALSELEALAALYRWTEVQQRAAKFLEDFPDSERAHEVRRALAGALLHLGQREEACRQLRALPPEIAPDITEACGQEP